MTPTKAEILESLNAMQVDVNKFIKFVDEGTKRRYGITDRYLTQSMYDEWRRESKARQSNEWPTTRALLLKVYGKANAQNWSHLMWNIAGKKVAYNGWVNESRRIQEEMGEEPDPMLGYVPTRTDGAVWYPMSVLEGVLKWRDVRQWCPRQESYIVVGKESVWEIR